MITDKEALQAARTLQGYCEGKWCDKCIFRINALNCCRVMMPSTWDLPDGIPAAAKDHLMRRFTRVE